MFVLSAGSGNGDESQSCEIVLLIVGDLPLYLKSSFSIASQIKFDLRFTDFRST